jgi:hypothetical protein
VASQNPPGGNSGLWRPRIFDGLAPSGFIRPGGRKWPWGKLRNAFLDHEPVHADEAAAKKWHDEAAIAFRAVRELALLAQRWLTWRTQERLSQEAAARRLQVSRPRLAAFEDGTRFPEWDLPWRIKALAEPTPEPTPEPSGGRQAVRGRR